MFQHPLTLEFVFMCFLRFRELTDIISLNSVSQLILLTVKCGVFFAVRTELYNNI
jgi:hypothetical protein